MRLCPSQRYAALFIALAIAPCLPFTGSVAQSESASAVVDKPVNTGANPYVAEPDFFKLPPGRKMGSTSAVAVDHEGHIWVVDRCGVNDCAGSALDPIMEFDAKGNFVKAFGKGMLLFPHGVTIDNDNHLWITDAHVGNGKGDDILEFDRAGKLLRTLGKPGVSGVGPGIFHEPNAILVAPNGDIFVAEGHTEDKSSARIVKFDHDGKFITQWGETGSGAGQMNVPHSLAMDREGRLYVADRWNNRIEVFDQNGRLENILTQFSRPSGIYIDKNDIVYSVDSESRTPVGYGFHPGWKRGIRIGSVKDGVVTAFIPDADPNPDKGATSGGEGIWVDDQGVIYSAEVNEKAVVRYVRK
jgi:sugar lactone lactonase YvrE